MGDTVANDVIAGKPVVVFSRDDGAWGIAFSRELDGKTLTFTLENGVITDEETGSIWSIFGEAIGTTNCPG